MEKPYAPAPCITRRYPDRLIINVTSACAMFCRHCQRRRLIGECDSTRSKEDILAAIQYIRENEELTGYAKVSWQGSVRSVCSRKGEPFYKA